MVSHVWCFPLESQHVFWSLCKSRLLWIYLKVSFVQAHHRIRFWSFLFLSIWTEEKNPVVVAGWLSFCLALRKWLISEVSVPPGAIMRHQCSVELLQCQALNQVSTLWHRFRKWEDPKKAKSCGLIKPKLLGLRSLSFASPGYSFGCVVAHQMAYQLCEVTQSYAVPWRSLGCWIGHLVFVGKRWPLSKAYSTRNCFYVDFRCY